VAQAAVAVEIAMLTALAALGVAAGEADVIQLVRLRGFVRANEDFTQR